MKALIREIREQPEHIRHVFMWVMVVITFSIVGFVWFRSTQQKFVALLNPEEAQQAAVLASQTKTNNPSPFATIGNALKDLRANISELIGSKPVELSNSGNAGHSNEEVLPPQKLPLSGNK